MSPWCGQGREIHVQEVALRDGLQSEAGFVPTENMRFRDEALSFKVVEVISVWLRKKNLESKSRRLRRVSTTC